MDDRITDSEMSRVDERRQKRIDEVLAVIKRAAKEIRPYLHHPRHAGNCFRHLEMAEEEATKSIVREKSSHKPHTDGSVGVTKESVLLDLFNDGNLTREQYEQALKAVEVTEQPSVTPAPESEPEENVATLEDLDAKPAKGTKKRERRSFPKRGTGAEANA